MSIEKITRRIREWIADHRRPTEAELVERWFEAVEAIMARGRSNA